MLLDPFHSPLEALPIEALIIPEERRPTGFKLQQEQLTNGFDLLRRQHGIRQPIGSPDHDQLFDALQRTIKGILFRVRLHILSIFSTFLRRHLFDDAGMGQRGGESCNPLLEGYQIGRDPHHIETLDFPE